MKRGVSIVVVLVAFAGCAAPVAGPAQPSTPASPTPSPTATPSPTPAGPTVKGLGATIERIDLTERAAVATVSVTNYDQTPVRGSLAFRFVENDSHALVGETTLKPGASTTFEAPLRLYGDDPANLTVQVRVNGTVVAERAVRTG